MKHRRMLSGRHRYSFRRTQPMLTTSGLDHQYMYTSSYNAIYRLAPRSAGRTGWAGRRRAVRLRAGMPGSQKSAAHVRGMTHTKLQILQMVNIWYNHMINGSPADRTDPVV